MLDHSPESYVGQHTSMVRNTLSLTSLAIAIIGFGAFYKSRERDTSYLAMKVAGLFIFIYAALYGAKGTFNFWNYIRYIERREGDELPELYVRQLSEWKEWVYFHIACVAMIAVVTVVFFAHIVRSLHRK